MAANGSNGNGKPSAPSFVGWIVLFDAGGDLLGKLSSSDLAAAEESIRREMREGVTPSATLSPVYRLSTFVLPVNGQIQPVASIARIEDSIQCGKNARLPVHVLLTRFSFLSELDEASRAGLARKIDDIERVAQADRSGILLAR